MRIKVNTRNGRERKRMKIKIKEVLCSMVQECDSFDPHRSHKMRAQRKVFSFVRSLSLYPRPSLSSSLSPSLPIAVVPKRSMQTATQVPRILTSIHGWRVRACNILIFGNILVPWKQARAHTSITRAQKYKSTNAVSRTSFFGSRIFPSPFSPKSSNTSN